VNGNNTLEEEIREWIAKGNKAFHANKTLFKSKLVSRKSKLKLYWSVIRPTVVYCCETWVLKENIIQKLSVFERKILRKIFGSTKKNDGTLDFMTRHQACGAQSEILCAILVLCPSHVCGCCGSHWFFLFTHRLKLKPNTVLKKLEDQLGLLISWFSVSL
jgi:hypothetical protein